MPLTPEQIAALDTAAAALAGAEASDVADALKDKLAAPYQAVYARGFGTHKGETAPQLATLREQIETLTAERDAAKAEAATAGSADAETSAKIQRLEDALTAAKQEAKDAKTGAVDKIKALHASRERAALVADLVKSGVDPDYAEQVLAPKLAARIRVADPADDGTASVDYLDADGLTPLQSGRAGLAEAAVATVDPKWITSRADGGAGTNGRTAAPGGYDPVAAGKAMAETQKGAGTKNLAFT